VESAVRARSADVALERVEVANGRRVWNRGAEVDLSDRVLGDIRSALRDVARAEVDVDVRIDPNLIGGLVVKMGSRMIDASLRTKLNSIRLAMREVR
jgi:F0F1-type ATP synthase delta subunit